MQVSVKIDSFEPVLLSTGLSKDKMLMHWSDKIENEKAYSSFANWYVKLRMISFLSLISVNLEIIWIKHKQMYQKWKFSRENPLLI